MQRHQGQKILSIVLPVDVRHQRHILQELTELRCVALRLIVRRLTDDFLDVLETGLGFDRSFRPDLHAVAGVIPHRLDQRLDREAVLLARLRLRLEVAGLPELLPPAVHELDELRQLRAGLSTDADHRCTLRGLQQGDTVLRGRGIRRIGPELLKGRLADAALRHVDNALEGDIIRAVRDQLHVREDILDLPALVEVDTADDLIRHVHLDALLLEQSRLRVRPIEHRLVMIRPAAVPGLPDHRLCLIIGPLKLLETDIRTALFLGPQLLLLPAMIVADDCIGTVEDLLGRAIVLLELDHARAREALLEAQDVLEVRATECIDALVVITDDAEIPVLLRERMHETELDIVRILVLVDHDVAEALLIVLKHLRLRVKQLHGLQQEIIEVERLVLVQLLLIELEAVRHLPHTEITAARLLLSELERTQAPVLRTRNHRQHHTLLKHLRVNAELLQHLLHQRPLIIRIIDGEIRLVTETIDVAPKDANTHRVEGRYPDLTRLRPDQPVDTLPHLPRCLIRERNREDVPRRDPAVLDEIGHTMRQHTRLTRTRTRQHQQRPLRTAHRLTLLLIQNSLQIFHSSPKSQIIYQNECAEIIAQKFIRVQARKPVCPVPMIRYRPPPA